MKNDAKATRAHYRRIRRELSVMLGYGAAPNALSIDKSMRLDTLFGLKLALDEQRGRLYRGEAPDTGEMLRLSEALERYLPKQPEPVADDSLEGIDPHKTLEDQLHRLWDAKEAERAEKAAERREQGLSEPFTDLDEAQARIDELEARLAEFESGNNPKSLSSPGAKIITPSDSDIVPPGEIGEFYAGPLPSKPVPPQPVSSAEVQARAARVNNDRSAYQQQGCAPRAVSRGDRSSAARMRTSFGAAQQAVVTGDSRVSESMDMSCEATK